MENFISSEIVLDLEITLDELEQLRQGETITSFINDIKDLGIEGLRIKLYCNNYVCDKETDDENDGEAPFQYKGWNPIAH